jgi:hypothetical protein
VKGRRVRFLDMTALLAVCVTRRLVRHVPTEAAQLKESLLSIRKLVDPH